MAYKPSTKIKKMKRRKIIKKLFFYYFSPLFFISAFFFFIYSVPIFHIRNILVKGVEKVNADQLIRITKDEMSGRYFYILDKNHIWFYPEKKIEDRILNLFPRIKNIDIFSKNWGRDIEIQVKEKKEKYLWCRDGGEKCYFMSEDGEVFDQTETNKDDLIKFFGPSREYLKKIENFEQIIVELNNFGLKIKKIEQDNLNNFKLVLEDDYKILLDNSFDTENILKRLRVILSYRDFKIDKKNRKFVNRVYYINMMHGNKIYYCLNDIRCAGNY